MVTTNSPSPTPSPEQKALPLEETEPREPAAKDGFFALLIKSIWEVSLLPCLRSLS